MRMIERLKNSRFLKQHFGWKLAFCWHPMYLLVDEDRGEPAVGERIEPWGSPDAATYVKKVRNNLVSLDRIPGLRLNYQFSGVEMEALARDFPDVLSMLREKSDAGTLDFLDGSYSQPHLQVLGSESNWRQFETGLAVFERLFGKRIKVHARQETGLHLQLPQLLRRFGYEFMVLPHFTWNVEVVEGAFELIGHGGRPAVTRADEFVEAVSLDGSTLPAYIATGAQGGRWREEFSKDLFSAPPIWILFPDMKGIAPEEEDGYCVSKEQLAEYQALFDIVLLKDALEERFEKSPPRARAKVGTYWSYVEGVWAEELLRKNKEAEEAAVLAGSMLSMARLAGSPVDRRGEIEGIWRTILKYQHHDVSWIEVTDLRRKAVERLDAGVTASRGIMRDVAADLVDNHNERVAVFNGLPRPRRALIETAPDAAPGGDAALQRVGERSIGFVDLPACGFASFPVAGEGGVASREAPVPRTLETDHFRIDLSEQGLVKQIVTAGGKELLRTDDYLGGEIRALMAGERDEWTDNHEAGLTFFEGDVCFVLERSASLGRVPLRERYLFFRREPAIKVELEFDFDGDEIGCFWLDETKANVYWPTRGGRIDHDIPFGYVEARAERPIFATSWLACGGVVYVNRGTVKHWVRDGVIANVLAWGGRNFSNRLHWGWTDKTQYDICLYGKQKIEYLLLPYGEFDGNRIVRDVEALTRPVFVAWGGGERSFCEIADKNLAVTALHEADGKVRARGYKLPSDGGARFRDWEIFDEPLAEVE